MALAQSCVVPLRVFYAQDFMFDLFASTNNLVVNLLSRIVGSLVVFAMSEQIIRLRVVVCFLTPVQVCDPFLGANNCYTSELARRQEAMRIAQNDKMLIHTLHFLHP